MGQHADEKILRDSGVQLCRFYEAADESPLDVVGCWFNSRAAFWPNLVTNDLVIGVPLSKPVHRGRESPEVAGNMRLTMLKAREARPGKSP